MADVIVTTLRLLGQRQYVSGLSAASGAVRDLDAATRESQIGGRTFGRSLDRQSKVLPIFARGIKTGATALGALAGIAGIVGLKTAGMIEQNEAAFATLVGGEAKAKRLTQQLIKLANTAELSTLGVADLIPATRLLAGTQELAFRRLRPLTRAMGDIVTVSGTGGEGMYGFARAISQSIGRGYLLAEELNQLTDATQGLVGRKQISKALDYQSVGRFTKAMEKGKIRTGEIVQAILEIGANMRPAAKKMGDTFLGQLAQIRENTSTTLGVLFRPMAGALARDVLPAINRILLGIQKWARQGGVRRFIAQLREVWNQTQSTRQLIGYLGKAIIFWIKNVGIPIVKAWVAGFRIGLTVLNAWHSLLIRVGKAGVTAGKAIGNAFTVAFKAIKTVAGPVLLWLSDKLRWIIDKISWVLDKAGDVADLLPKIPTPGLPKLPGLPDLPGIPKPPFLQHGTPRHRGGLAIVGETGPELVNIPKGASVSPMTSHAIDMTGLGGKTRFHFEIPVIMDGKQITRVVADRTANDVARSPYGSGFSSARR